MYLSKGLHLGAPKLIFKEFSSETLLALLGDMRQLDHPFSVSLGTVEVNFSMFLFALWMVHPLLRVFCLLTFET